MTEDRFIPFDIKQALDKYSVDYTCTHIENNIYCAELEVYTKTGGSEIFNVVFDYQLGDEIETSKSFIKGLFSEYLEFDRDKYVWYGLEKKINNPYEVYPNATELVKEANEIESILCNLVNECKTKLAH